MTTIALQPLTGLHTVQGRRIVPITDADHLRATPLVKTCLIDAQARVRRQWRSAPDLCIAASVLPREQWRRRHAGYAAWLEADCPLIGAPGWRSSMVMQHVQAWGDDPMHGGWSAQIDFLAMYPRGNRSADAWLDHIEAEIATVWEPALEEAGLKLCSDLPHTPTFGIVEPTIVEEGSLATARALNGLSGCYGGGGHGAHALAVSWLMLDGKVELPGPMTDLSPAQRAKLAALGLTMAMSAPALLSAPAVTAAVNAQWGRLTGDIAPLQYEDR